ncbi:MAG: TonB-dependent receptor, partial [Ignavibacteriae bacterium]|nr:TonB-dependent receptor [Ignavibacteriota bacterium]
VSFVQSQVNIRGSTGYSKGVGTRVLILVDGLPMLSGDTGEIIWESFPVNNIERIEIVKGAGSALFGSSALGGVINIITKSASEIPETRLQLYGGMYDSPYYPEWKWSDKTRFVNGLRLSHQRKIGNVSVLAIANRTEDDGYQMNNHWTRWNGWLKIGVESSPYESFSFSAGVLDQRRGNFLYWKNLDSALIPPANQLDDRVESFRWNLGGAYKRILSPETFLTFKSSLYQTKWEDNIPNSLDTNGNRSTSSAMNFEGQVVHQFSPSNIFTGGIYTNFSSVDADAIFGKHSSTCFAGFFQDEVELMLQLRLTIGGRLDYHRLEGTESEQHFNPKFGLTFNPNEGTSARLAIGRGFRAPSAAEVYSTTDAAGIAVIPNPLLRSEHSWSYEVGGTQILGNNMMAEVSLFRNEFWDLIEPTFNTSGQVQFQNITRARIQGAEINLRTSWFDGVLSGDVGYTYIYPEDISKNDLMKYRPRHLLYVNGNVSIHPLELGIDFRFISKADRIDEEFAVLGIIKQGEKRVPAYVTDLHLNTDWDFAGLPLSSSFHVNNLFNYNYVELIGNIAPIRNFVLMVEGKW